MSVRRLAEASVQPASFAFNRANAAWAKQTIRKYPKGRQASAVIPLLMRAQEQEGWVTRSAIEHVAVMLDMPFIRVLEVATFYTQFQLKPVGTRAHVQVCGTTPCMLRGSEDLMKVCRERIHPEQFHTNAAGTLSWEEVECLGACVNAPMVMIFKDAYEDLTPERLAEIIDEFEAGRGATVATGPQNGRVFSAPAAGLTSLVDEKAVLKESRDRESGATARGEREAARQAEGAVAPSRAAKPKTDAPETDPTLRSPSKVKVSPKTEQSASVAPKVDEAAADLADPAVEMTKKRRTHADRRKEDPSLRAPEAQKETPIGPDAKRAEAAAPAPVGSPMPEAPAPAAPASQEGRPPEVARPAVPDDLKLISGVGPKLEGVLNGLGIYTYAQIAAWTKTERDWVDGYLRFKGRIERDDWVKQAEALANGGEAEYVRVFGKKPR